MMKANHLRRFRKSGCGAMMLVVAFALTACGGGASSGSSTSPVIEQMDGSGPAIGTYTQFAETSGEPSDLIAITFDGNFEIDRYLAGTLDHATGVISGGALAGTLNGQRTVLNFSSGGEVEFSNQAETEYLRLVRTQGLTNDRFGVLGQVTDPSDMPGAATGSAVYNGVVVMSLQNDGGLYSLTGDARITADWGNSVDTRLSGFSGSLNEGGSQRYVGVIEIKNATLSGTTFEGGTLLRSGAIFRPVEPVTGLLEGQFFGPNADEVGGVFIIDADTLKVKAIFAAE